MLIERQVRRLKRLIWILALLVLLSGCAAQEQIVPEESRLTVWTCLEESAYEPLVKEFQQRTGIWVQVETGSAAELLRRLPDGNCDLLLGFDVNWLEMAKDFLEPITTEAEFIKECPTGENWVPLTLEPVVLVYNPLLVRHNPPTGWRDLLAPEWKGEIAFAAPYSSDFSTDVLDILIKETPWKKPEAVIAEFFANVQDTAADETEVCSRVISGNDYLAALPEDVALAQQEQGASLSLVYPWHTYLLAEGGGIPTRAVHKENAEAFLRFALGTDAQRYAMEHSRRGSVLKGLNSVSRYSQNTVYPGAEAAVHLWRQLEAGE